MRQKGQAKTERERGGILEKVDETEFISHTSGPTIFGGASIVAIISATVASGKSSIGSGTRRRFLASDGLQLPDPSGVTDSVLLSPKLQKQQM